jgi:hypothetical protein
MTRVLTSLALIVSQALPWAAGPLFVCTDDEGAVCIDRGPGMCDCCAIEADVVIACDAGHAASTCGKPAVATHVNAVNALTPAPCDCAHELVEAVPSIPALRLAAGAVERPDQASLGNFAAIDAASAGAFELFASMGDEFASATAHQRLLSSVALRC